jgi:hypothetical protein
MASHDPEINRHWEDGKAEALAAAPTQSHWHPRGAWKCVCTTPTHKRGQRFTSPQCTYCVRVRVEDQ